MEFDEFIRVMKERVAVRCTQMDVTVSNIVKNNGTVLHGLIMRPKDKSVNVAPTVYLEDFYEELRSGTDLNDIVDQALSALNFHMGKVYDFNVSAVTNPDYMRSHIFMSLVNKEKNAVRLKDCPHMDFYDLSIEYRVHVNELGYNGCSYLVKNDTLVLSGIHKSELHELALKNTKELFGCSVRPMRDIFAEVSGSDANLEDFDTLFPMYVITNRDGVRGAANIFYDETLSHVAENLGDDLIVLPSSIHEVICMPASVGSAEEMSCMVRTINADHVTPEEQLSDNVYLYDAKEHLLSDVDTYEKNHSQETEQFNKYDEYEAEGETYARPAHHR